MKKFLFILIAIISIFFLVGCNEEKTSDTSKGSSSAKSEDVIEKKEPHMVDYKDTNFTDATDFYVTKDDSLSYVTYDRCLLQNRDLAQLDLNIADGQSGDTKATLIVKRDSSILFISGEDNGKIINVSSFEVIHKFAEDGINRYLWSSGDFSYELSSKKEFTSTELEKLLNGFQATISGDLYQ